MAARDLFVDDRAGWSVSVTGTAEQTMLTTVWTPKASTSYAIFVTGMGVISNQGTVINVKKGSTTYAQLTGSYGTARTPLQAMWVESFGASPGAQTYTVTGYAAASDKFAGCEDYRFVAVELTASDLSSYPAISTQTSSSTTDVDLLSLSVTGDGDWLVLGGLSMWNDQSGTQTGMACLDVGGTNYGDSYLQEKDCRNTALYATKITVSGGGTTTVKLQARTLVGSFKVDRVCLVALKLSGFDVSSVGQSTASVSGTSTTLGSNTDHANPVTMTPGAYQHLVIATMNYASNSATQVAVKQRLLEGTLPIGEACGGSNTYPTAQGGSLSNPINRTIVYATPMPTSSTTWKWQYASVPGTDTVQLDETLIAVLQAGPSSVRASVAAGADDGHATTAGGSFLNSATVLSLGRDAIGTWDSFFRFTGIAIPQGATITDAILRFWTPSGGSGGGTNLRFRAWAADNPSAPGTAAAVVAGPFTTAVVDWSSVPAWSSTNIIVHAPELKTVLQEVVNRSGWASGSALIIDVVDNGGTGTSSNRVVSSYEGTRAPELLISYVAAGGGPQTYSVTVTATQGSAAALRLTPSRALAAAQPSAAAIARRPSRALSASQGSSAAVTARGVFPRLFSAVQPVAGVVVRRGAVSVRAAQPSAAAARTAPGITRAAAQPSAGSVRTGTGRTFAATQGSTAAVAASRVLLRAFAATQGSAAAIVRRAARAVTAAQPSAAAAAVSATFRRASSATQPSAAALQLRAGRSVSGTQGSAAAVSALRVLLQTVTATQGSAAAVSVRQSLSRAVTAAQPSAAAVRLHVSRTVRALSGSAASVRLQARVAAVAAQGSAAGISTRQTYRATVLAAQSASAAVSVRQSLSRAVTAAQGSSGAVTVRAALTISAVQGTAGSVVRSVRSVVAGVVGTLADVAWRLFGPGTVDKPGTVDVLVTDRGSVSYAVIDRGTAAVTVTGGSVDVDVTP